MNYSITLTGGMNARRDAKVIGYKMTDTPNNIIALLPAGTIAEGDALSADGKWLDVLMINGMQVAEPTFLATYTTNGKLITNLPPAPIEPNIEVKVTLFDDWTGQVDTVVNSVVVSTWTGRIKPPVG